MKRSIFYTISLLLILAATSSLFGQATYLPHHLSDEEVSQLPFYTNDYRESAGIPNPPFSAIRTPAEWEEAQALVVTWTWPVNIVRQIVEHAIDEVPVYIVCTDSNNVKSDLLSNGIPIDNINYMEAPFNSVWIRDYGQWSVYTDDVDSLLLVDWIYNRPRPEDDQLPATVAEEFDLPIYTTTQIPNDLVHTGGNFMVDGFGTGFSSKLVLDENNGGAFNLSDKSEDEIDVIMEQFMGINRYIKMDELPYDLIHHIDMHMKLIDEETLLVGQYPPGVADGPYIEENLNYVLSNFNSVFGTPYDVVRIPMPPDQFDRYPDVNGYYRTFTNSLFINKLVLVPIYEEQYDTTALRIYREALPGYNIVGINCNEIIPASGAIHCITKLVHSSDPLLISHQHLDDTYVTDADYTINAYIKHRSGIQEAFLRYKTDESTDYQVITMTNVEDDTWTAAIPAQVAGTTIYYYIEAFSNSGKEQVRPLPAPEAYWSFRVLGTATSIWTAINQPEVYFYPNPSDGNSQLLIRGLPGKEFITVEIYDILGRKKEQIFRGEGDQENMTLSLNLTSYPTGTYFLHVQHNQQSVIKKLLIERQ